MTLEQLVYRKFNERLSVYKAIIYNGVPNWDEYQRVLGVCQGMIELMAEIDPLIKDPDGPEDEQ
jgi:hypothetical protein